MRIKEDIMDTMSCLAILAAVPLLIFSLSFAVGYVSMSVSWAFRENDDEFSVEREDGREIL